MISISGFIEKFFMDYRCQYIMHSISPWAVLFLNTVQNLSFEFLDDRSLTILEIVSTTTILV